MTLVFSDIRWFSRIHLSVVSPRGIRRRVQILSCGGGFPFKAADDLFQVDQQQRGPIRDAVGWK
jgi:hypothetical protein